MMLLFLVPLQEQGLEEKVLMRNGLHASPVSTECLLCSLVSLHLSSIGRPDLPVADVGNLSKCQCRHTQGLLQDKLLNITSLAADLLKKEKHPMEFSKIEVVVKILNSMIFLLDTPLPVIIPFQSIMALPSEIGNNIYKTGAKSCAKEEREVRICERNNSADPKVSEDGGGGGAPGIREDAAHDEDCGEAAVPLQPMEAHCGAQIHQQPVEDPMLEQVDD
ncbi:hypothetical protein BTVI_104633 [Pitangus sulphuratus]|nr:hypothetical protein BTVI_104633 [Pitangus sulphuratus]